MGLFCSNIYGYIWIRFGYIHKAEQENETETGIYRRKTRPEIPVKSTFYLTWSAEDGSPKLYILHHREGTRSERQFFW